MSPKIIWWIVIEFFDIFCVQKICCDFQQPTTTLYAAKNRNIRFSVNFFHVSPSFDVGPFVVSLVHYFFVDGVKVPHNSSWIARWVSGLSTVFRYLQLNEEMRCMNGFQFFMCSMSTGLNLRWCEFDFRFIRRPRSCWWRRWFFVAESNEISFILQLRRWCFMAGRSKWHMTWFHVDFSSALNSVFSICSVFTVSPTNLCLPNH